MAYLDFFPVPMDAQTTVVLAVAVGLSMAGLAIAFIVAEPRSPITRPFAIAYGVTGLGIITDTAFVYLYADSADIPWFARFTYCVTIATWAYPLWLLRMARTAQPTPRAMRWITGCVWLQWTMVLIVFVLSGIYAQERLRDFYMALGHERFWSKPGFWIFAVPIFAGTLNLTLGGAILFTQRIDPAERHRAFAFAVSFPLLGCVFILPAGYNLLACLIGEIVFLFGAVRYYVMQGERSLFMSRFLSPQVAKLVEHQGLGLAMKPQKLEITVVCCDLRAFTHYSQEHDSDQVTQLLADYYQAVGSVVADFGATIKDYSGDGILILVGAPLPVADHAQQGLQLAERALHAARAVLQRWPQADMLGVGVGVASGTVTVGAIGSSHRMDYTAIGPAVNLASRLCALAKDREILVDARTSELAHSGQLRPRGQLAVKGIGEVVHFALASE